MPSRFERTPFALPADECRENANVYEQTIAGILARPTLRMDDLDRLVHVGIDAAAYRCSVDPSAASIRHSLRVAASGAAALFALAAQPAGSPALILFPDGERSFTCSPAPQR